MRGINRSVPALLVAVTFMLTAMSFTIASAQVTAFSYQGQLNDDGVGVNADRARFLFKLWDAPIYGHQIGDPCELTMVEIVDGIFTVFLDFGESAFDGNVRYLSIGVDVSGGTDYTWLEPRQPIAATPLAVHALHGGDNPWNIDGTDLYYTLGDIGIGTTSPTYPLTVHSSRPDERIISGVSTSEDAPAVGVWGEVDASGGTGVHGESNALSGEGYGVHGDCASRDGAGVYGWNGNTSGPTRGVFGKVRSSDGYGVYGENSSSTAPSIGVYGETGSSTGFGGYFLGRGYFSDRVGIGTASPSTTLDVAGTARMDGFKLDSAPQDGYVLTSDGTGIGTWQPVPSSGGFWQQMGDNIYYDAGKVGIGTQWPGSELQVIGTVEMNGLQLHTTTQDGYVLTSDASGNGSWQPAPEGGDFDLPYNGSVSSSVPAFSVTNTGTGWSSHGIEGVINNPNSSSDVAAGSFVATGSNGFAITAFSDARSGVYSDHDGPNYAFYGLSSGAGAGYFRGSGSAHGIYASADGEFANAINCEATGGGAAIVAEASMNSQTGIIARGSGAAARFYGHVDIYEYGTNNKVIELGKGLDYAEGFDITEAGDAEIPKGSVLVIDPSNPGHLTRCRQAYDNKVAGIVAGANGLGSGVRLGAGEFDHDVALAGRVYCNVVALDGDIQPGDLLTTSDVPGYAMKVTDHTRAQGAVLGKAMEPLGAGQRGQILVLVTLQ